MGKRQEKSIVLAISLIPWWIYALLSCILCLIPHKIYYMQHVASFLLVIFAIISKAKALQRDQERGIRWLSTSEPRIIAKTMIRMTFLLLIFCCFRLIAKSAFEMIELGSKQANIIADKISNEQKKNDGATQQNVNWKQYGYNQKIEPVYPQKGRKPNQDEFKKWIDNKGVIHISNISGPEDADAVAVRPKVVPIAWSRPAPTPEKKVISYTVHLKTGEQRHTKEVRQDNPGMLSIVEGPITTEMPVTEVSSVEELSNAGSRMIDLQAGF